MFREFLIKKSGIEVEMVIRVQCCGLFHFSSNAGRFIVSVNAAIAVITQVIFIRQPSVYRTKQRQLFDQPFNKTKETVLGII